MTEQLQAERSLSKKQGLQLNQYESQIQELRNQLKEKEVTMAELEKEKLFSTQNADKVQHFEAKSHHSRTLQQELLNSQVLHSYIYLVSTNREYILSYTVELI